VVQTFYVQLCTSFYLLLARAGGGQIKSVIHTTAGSFIGAAEAHRTLPRKIDKRYYTIL
jgi:hypothetical protein